MEKIILTANELKGIVDNSKLIGFNEEASIITFQDRLIEMDSILYNLLKNHEENETDKWIKYRYLGGKENYNDLKQIEYLSKVQDNVYKSKLPQGVVILDQINVSPGVVIPFHREYQNLDKFDKKNVKLSLIIMEKLLEAIRELEENKISQNDLYHPDGRGNASYSILYKNDDPQIIDLSGQHVECGKKYKDARAMYIELGQVLIDFFDANNLEAPYQRWYTDDYDKNKKLVKTFESNII